MNLTPREKDKLLVAVAAMVAARRLERGVRLNYPEAVALITDYVLEGARDGKTVAELMRDCAICNPIPIPLGRACPGHPRLSRSSVFNSRRGWPGQARPRGVFLRNLRISGSAPAWRRGSR